MAINWMRCDIAVVGFDGTPLAVIEVQGSKHYGESFDEGLEARIKDQIKREACRRAGIPMIEIHADAVSSVYQDVRFQLSAVLEKSAA